MTMTVLLSLAVSYNNILLLLQARVALHVFDIVNIDTNKILLLLQAQVAIYVFNIVEIDTVDIFDFKNGGNRL